MLSFLDLPPETHDHIAEYLYAVDVATLSLTCKKLNIRLGPSNNLLWFTRLRASCIREIGPGKAAWDPDAVNTRLNIFGLAEYSEKLDYWKIVRRAFCGAAGRMCSNCLIFKLKQKDFFMRGIFVDDKLKEPVLYGSPRAMGQIDRYSKQVRYYFCSKCLRDVFFDVTEFKLRFPEVRVSEPWDALSVGQGVYVIRKSVARRLVEQQLGPCKIAAQWQERLAAQIAHRKKHLSKYAVKAIEIVLDVYHGRFTRYHRIIPKIQLRSVLEASLVYGTGLTCIEKDRLIQKKYNSAPKTRDPHACIGIAVELTRMYYYLYYRREDVLQAKEVLRSVKIMAFHILTTLFQVDDSQPFRKEEMFRMHPHVRRFLIDWIWEWYRTKYSPWDRGRPQKLSSRDKFSGLLPPIFCYWCKREDPKNMFLWSEGLPIHQLESRGWYGGHLIECHQDKLGKRSRYLLPDLYKDDFLREQLDNEFEGGPDQDIPLKSEVDPWVEAFS